MSGLAGSDAALTLSSIRSIAQVAIPALLLNAAAPLASATQTALLGHYSSTHGLAAFTAAGGLVAIGVRLFVFLVDGVSSKVGHAVATAPRVGWGQVTSTVNLSLAMAAACGAGSVALLGAVRRPVFVHLLRLSAEVQAEAAPYFWARLAAVPVQLMNMSCSGILQGFHHVSATAALGIAQAGVELIGSATALLSGHGLLGVGLATLGSQLLLAVASLAALLLLPPPEGRGGRYSLRTAWFGEPGSSSTAECSIIDAQVVLLPPGDTECSNLMEERPTVLLEALSDVAAGEDHHLLQPASPSARVPPRPVAESQQLGDDEAGRVLLSKDDGNHVASEHFWAFVRDGADFLIRSLILQLTFFGALVAASRLGTDALAAHSAVSQLWILLSNVVDGLAAAGIVLGSRLAGLAADGATAAPARSSAQRLVRRLVLAGLVMGLATAAVFWLAASKIRWLFTRHAAVIEQLHGVMWAVLTVSQPLNACVFVYDGLLYAAQGFAFIRRNFVSGFVLLFCPMLAWEWVSIQSLWAVWLAKTVFNVWRLGGAVLLIHGQWLRQF